MSNPEVGLSTEQKSGINRPDALARKRQTVRTAPIVVLARLTEKQQEALAPYLTDETPSSFRQRPEVKDREISHAAAHEREQGAIRTLNRRSNALYNKEQEKSRKRPVGRPPNFLQEQISFIKEASQYLTPEQIADELKLQVGHVVNYMKVNNISLIPKDPPDKNILKFP